MRGLQWNFEKKSSFTGFIVPTLTKNGELLHCEVNAQAILNEKDELIGYKGVLRDISSRINAEKKIQQEKLRKDLALKAGTIGIWEWNYDFEILNINFNLSGFCYTLDIDINFEMKIVSVHSFLVANFRVSVDKFLISAKRC